MRLVKLKYVLQNTALFEEQPLTADASTLRSVSSHSFLHILYVFCVLIHMGTQ